VRPDYTREGVTEKSKRAHRLPNATPEDVIHKTGEIRRMEGSGGHAVAGSEAVRKGGRGKPQPWWASLPAMEFQSRYGSSNLLWNSIAVAGVCGGSALGAWSDTTSERLHSYGISQLTRLLTSAAEFHS
jgi:hypothetical protein